MPTVHIRYSINAYASEDVSKLKDKIREKLKVKLDDDIKIASRKNSKKISITFRTPENERVLTPQELDKILSSLGITAFRIIITKVITYEIESGVGGGVGVGTVTGVATKRTDASILAGILAGLIGYALGKTIEKLDEVIGFYEKRKESWVKI
jgi:hypothetical protein